MGLESRLHSREQVCTALPCRGLGFGYQHGHRGLQESNPAPGAPTLSSRIHGHQAAVQVNFFKNIKYNII